MPLLRLRYVEPRAVIANAQSQRLTAGDQVNMDTGFPCVL